MIASIYVHFTAQNNDDEDPSPYVAKFFLYALKYPAMRLGQPLPQGYHMLACQLSSHPCSVDLVIRSEEEADIEIISSHIRERFCGPMQTFSKTTCQWEPAEQKTKVSVGLCTGTAVA